MKLDENIVTELLQANKRLMEINEKSQKSSSIKFYVVCAILAFVVAMYFICPADQTFYVGGNDLADSNIEQKG